MGQLADGLFLESGEVEFYVLCRGLAAVRLGRRGLGGLGRGRFCRPVIVVAVCGHFYDLVGVSGL
jgi:hypothetical protein